MLQFQLVLIVCLLDEELRSNAKQDREHCWVSSFAVTLLLFALQNAESVAATETLAEVPEHVLRGLPEEVRLLPSAVDKTRIGEYSHCGSRAAKRRLLSGGAGSC